MIADRTLDASQRELLGGVETRIAREDFVAHSNAGHYFQAGLSALRCIEDAIGAAGASRVERVLDFPSGYGRVLRFLVRRFPDAAFTAGDIDRGAVDFCARTFGAASLYSKTDFREIDDPGRFDLIWCGSLMTHIEPPRTVDLLRFFRDALSDHGILVFTTGGNRVAERLREGTDYDLAEGTAARLVADYARDGVAYADYPRAAGYGIALLSPDWVRGQIGSIGGVRIVCFGQAAWDHHQDVFGVVLGE